MATEKGSKADWIFVILAVVVIVVIQVFLGILVYLAPYGLDFENVERAASYVTATAQVTGTIAGFLIVAFIYTIQVNPFLFFERNFIKRNGYQIWLIIAMMYFSGLSLFSLLVLPDLLSSEVLTSTLSSNIEAIQLGTLVGVFLAFFAFAEVTITKIARDFYGFAPFRGRFKRK